MLSTSASQLGSPAEYQGCLEANYSTGSKDMSQGHKSGKSLWKHTKMHVVFINTTKCLWNKPVYFKPHLRASVFPVKESLWVFLNYGWSSLQKRTLQSQGGPGDGTSARMRHGGPVSGKTRSCPHLPGPETCAGGPAWGHAE